MAGNWLRRRSDFEIQTKVESERLERKLYEFARELGKDVAEILPAEAKHFVRDVVKLMPPFISLSTKESWGAQKKHGERAVKREIESAFRPLDDMPIFRNPEKPHIGTVGRRLLRSGDTEAVAAFLSNAGYTEVHARNVITEVTEDQHDELRNKRGKIRLGRRAAYYVIQKREIARFVKKKQALVGRLKGGFQAAAAHLGVTTPAWVRRHPGQGRVIDKTKAFINPRITMINDVSYAKTQNYDARFIAIAMKNRVGKISRQLAAKAQGRWKKAKVRS